LQRSENPGPLDVWPMRGAVPHQAAQSRPTPCDAVPCCRVAPPRAAPRRAAPSRAHGSRFTGLWP